jgi:hypothetical protein
MDDWLRTVERELHIA